MRVHCGAVCAQLNTSAGMAIAGVCYGHEPRVAMCISIGVPMVSWCVAVTCIAWYGSCGWAMHGVHAVGPSTVNSGLGRTRHLLSLRGSRTTAFLSSFPSGLLAFTASKN